MYVGASHSDVHEAERQLIIDQGSSMTASRLCACAILAMAAALSACGPPSTSPLVSSAVIVGLKISGPSTMAPGSAAQFSAVATHSNGSSEDVTATVQWHSSDTLILTISATGLASTIQAGDVNVTATLQSDPGHLPSSGHPFGPATQSILVVPAGTFRLSGAVRWLGSPIGGALVQVTAGTGAGLSSAGGPYRLYGVAGDIQLTVSRTDYVTIKQTVTVNSNTVLDFDLVTVNPTPDFAGTYSLRITADPGCATAGAGALPAIGRARQYAANISQDRTSLKVLLSGANFDQKSGNVLYGQLAPGGATFYVNSPGYYYSSYRDLAEVLPDGSVYLPSGTINLTRSANNLVGTLAGTITIRNSLNASDAIGQCTSTHHSVMFTSQGGSPARARIRQ
jgi:hypothetical protein